eukprot:scaffold39338_cov36-Phaeocystis_antarctica.AAC.1
MSAHARLVCPSRLACRPRWKISSPLASSSLGTWLGLGSELGLGLGLANPRLLVVWYLPCPITPPCVLPRRRHRRAHGVARRQLLGPERSFAHARRHPPPPLLSAPLHLQGEGRRDARLLLRLHLHLRLRLCLHLCLRLHLRLTLPRVWDEAHCHGVWELTRGGAASVRCLGASQSGLVVRRRAAG